MVTVGMVAVATFVNASGDTLAGCYCNSELKSCSDKTSGVALCIPHERSHYEVAPVSCRSVTPFKDNAAATSFKGKTAVRVVDSTATPPLSKTASSQDEVGTIILKRGASAANGRVGPFTPPRHGAFAGLSRLDTEVVQMKRGYTTVTQLPTTTTVYVTAVASTVADVTALPHGNSTSLLTNARECSSNMTTTFEVDSLTSSHPLANATATLSCGICLTCLMGVHPCPLHCLQCSSLGAHLSNSFTANATTSGPATQSKVTDVTSAAPITRSTSTGSANTSDLSTGTDQSCATNGMMGFSSCRLTAGGGTSGTGSSITVLGLKGVFAIAVATWFAGACLTI
ncbi:hypothetical protein K431DRAFT_300473 [Polychaeton citri CBS 116435]|uniref:Uncharacterized protein n=1 Tax=Polychaeton citri CBS 116435 TaxID=1314669 RepID=A0A9P4UUE4_9PEZI|nr:hypothetical protein K431DRAFT_300473 [Polychaeton citri CBS 116435]